MGMPKLLYRLALLLIAVLSAEGAAGKLPIVFCTPEHSKCPLASDGKLDTCFSAAHLEENFYFGVFNTVGQPVTVDKLLLNVGSHARTKYMVSLASGSEAHELNCSRQAGKKPAAAVLECPANLPNVTSIMIRSQPLQTRLNLLEVAAFNANDTQLTFSYCVAPESPSCEPARDRLVKAGSPAVVSELAEFPSWYGGLDGVEAVRKVTIHRPVAASADSKSGGPAATFYRVNAGKECEMAGGAKTDEVGVEVLEFRCSGGPSSLLQVWEIDAEYLISLCEVQVYGE